MGGIDGQVSWVVQCAVKDGQLDAFKELMEEMVAGTSEEAGHPQLRVVHLGRRRTVHSTRSTRTRMRPLRT